MPEDSYAPFLLTLAASAGFCRAAAAPLVARRRRARRHRRRSASVWLWPERRLGQRVDRAACLSAALSLPALPVGAVRRMRGRLVGLAVPVLTEGALFAYLLFSYFYFVGRSSTPPGRRSGRPVAQARVPNTVILLLSSVCVWWGERGIRAGRDAGGSSSGIGVGVSARPGFHRLQLLEWHDKPFSLRSSLYGSLVLHHHRLPHGACRGRRDRAGDVFLWSALGYFDRTRNAPVPIAAMYWHFVDAVWLAVFTTLYVTPYLG